MTYETENYYVEYYNASSFEIILFFRGICFGL